MDIQDAVKSPRSFFLYFFEKVLIVAITAIVAGLVLFFVQGCVNNDQNKHAKIEESQVIVAEQIGVFANRVQEASFEMREAIHISDTGRVNEIYGKEKDAIQELVCQEDMNQKAYAAFHDEIEECKKSINALNDFIIDVKARAESNRSQAILNNEQREIFLMLQQEVVDATLELSNHSSDVRYGLD